jgi:predicted nucleic acid-binding protein
MNILLDTNVLSELEGRMYSERLLNWLNGYKPEELFISAISIAEIQYGLARLPEGRRRAALTEAYAKIEAGFAGRIAAFTIDAAHRCGLLRAEREKSGRPIETKDAMIAAICLSNRVALATRNIKDFEGLDLKLVNPFEDG